MTSHGEAGDEGAGSSPWSSTRAFVRCGDGAQVGTGTQQQATDGVNSAAQTVLIADRGRAFAEALARLLTDAGLQATAGSYDQAAELCRSLRPAVLLLDGDPPVDQAREVAAAARRATGDVRILLLVGESARRQARTIAGVSADGLLSRQDGVEKVLAGIRGHPVPAPAPAARPRHGTNGRHNGSALDRLTPRELQVLRALMVGVRSAAIAKALEISPHTVRTHVQNTFAKLAVSSRLEAASIAREAGLRPLPLSDLGETGAGELR